MLIGITGKKRAGKDTFGDYLVENYNFSKYSFADPLKRGVQQFFDFTDDQLWGDSKDTIDERYGVSPRIVLQIFGSEVMQFDVPNHIPEFKKRFGRKFWVFRFKEFYKNNKDKSYAFCDIRFPFEAQAISDLGGYILQVERPSLESSDLHRSENEMSEYEGEIITIMNNSSLKEYRKEIENLCQKLLTN